LLCKGCLLLRSLEKWEQGTCVGALIQEPSGVRWDMR
jgi:hypothetical protein